MPKISVVIITKNEQEMIKNCIKSANLIADETVVIDQYSKDKTVSLAKKLGAKVYLHKFHGFASQKNYGVRKAKGDWIFILDADERITLELAQEILRKLKNPQAEAYSVSRQNYFYGEKINHGGWQNDNVVRLFKRNSASFGRQEIHEQLEVKGKTEVLKEKLLHFTHRSIYQNLLKTAQYSQLEAQFLFDHGAKKVNPWLVTRRMLKHFFYHYVILKGYKDGMAGFVEAVYQTFSYVFITQAMIWELQKKKLTSQKDTSH